MIWSFIGGAVFSLVVTGAWRVFTEVTEHGEHKDLRDRIWRQAMHLAGEQKVRAGLARRIAQVETKVAKLAKAK